MRNRSARGRKRRGWTGALFVTVVFVASIPVVAADDQPQPDWREARATKIVDQLTVPANIQFAADGSLWYAEVYSGDLKRFDFATGKSSLVYHVDSVSAGDERGLVGFALDPEHASNGAFYLYYTAAGPNPSGGTNRLVHVRDGAERVLVEIPAFKEHNGGQILVLPDKTLLVTTGENQRREPAQDLNSLLGKILRVTADGKAVDGNLKGLIYTRGHRNPYGLAHNPDTKEVWSTENSGWRRDEINVIEPGKNYGYPECEGLGLNGVDPPCPTDKKYTMPVLTFYENRTAAPTGATFWLGAFYWGSLREASIHHAWRNETGAWHDRVVFRGTEPVLDLEPALDRGSLYVATTEAIWRIEFPSLVVPAAPIREQGSSESTPGWSWVAAAFAALAVGWLLRRRRS
jgi:glucose/arabinose dehydrogenase